MTDNRISTSSLNRVEISRSALQHNFRLCKKLAGGAGVMVLVKADGYGHGMVECARVFAAEGAAGFGVAEACEGRILREAGVTQPIYVLVGLMEDAIEEMLDCGLTPVVVDSSLLPGLSAGAVQRGMEAGLHVKMDAGMGRQGCLPHDVREIVSRINELPGLRLDGVMAHFPMADEPESGNTMDVFGRFRETVDSVRNLLPKGCLLHIANSGGLFYFKAAALDMVRCGIAMYGCPPDGRSARLPAGQGELAQAMRFVTRVIQVRSVPAGTGLGYGQSCTTSRQTTIAVLPVGYEDGYLRKLSNRAEVLVNGQRAPVAGRISMNLTLADVTDVAGGVRRGDEVVLMGGQGKEMITADEVAGWMETISYEALCLFGNLNDRYYID